VRTLFAPPMSFSRALLLLILAGTLARLGFGWGIGLGIDESYMVVAGRGPLQLGYFDHPLVSWWMARGVADLVGSEAALVVRLPFIALFALSTWLMFRLTAVIADARAGLWAALAFNLSPLFGITTGGWVLPDGPLIAALLGAALCLVHALAGRGWGWWLGAGACLGLAMLSKYTAVLSVVGFVVFLLTQRTHRHWLARPQPYVAGLLAAAAFSPVIIWNAQHGWASLAFQGGRAAAARLHVFGPLTIFAGEAAFLLPWIWAGLMLVFWRGLRATDWRVWLLCCLAAPAIVLFALVSLWSRQVLFHWAAPGYLMLFPLLGAWLVECCWAPRAARATALLLGGAMLVVVGQVRLEFLPLPDDPGLQARDWTQLRPALRPYGLPVAALSWSDAGKIGIGLGPDVPLFCLNPDSREFRFSTTPPQSGDLLIVAPRRNLAQMQSLYGGLFDRIEALPPVPVGQTAIPIFIGHGLRRWVD
jgi:4-amino-4-deoxy-L-arabinose transferase-like glycosyltransferase